MSDLELQHPQGAGVNDEIALQAPSIGDRLRQARERRGVSIGDASSALKIRAPILEAFEREDHGQLPPRVYALGQLRTYAAYLGLDPATVAAGWQGASSSESVASTTAAPGLTSAVDRFASMRPGFIRSTRGVLAMGGLGLVVLAISGFMALQLLRFILPPSIAITYPIEAISNLEPGTLVFELKGTADAHASIVIETSAGAQLTTAANESGLWSLLIPVGTGRTEVMARAVKAGTGGEPSTTAERVFIVALPDTVAPEITVTQPSTNLAVVDGEVPIALQTAANCEVGVTATDTSGRLITATVTSDANGSATGGMALPAGRWTLSFSVTTAAGGLGQATRTVDVSFSGVVVTVTGGASSTWIRVWIDGQTDPAIGVSGKTIAPGVTVRFKGSERIEIRSGNPSALIIMLNGSIIGDIGSGTNAETYAFLSTGKVQRSSRR